KLTRKGADVIIANLVGGGAGFGDVANEVLVVERGASSVTLGARTKDRLAVAIWDRLQERLGRETTSATPNVSPRRGELDESALPGGENR
ncbi:MAG: hypothetical protein KC609_05215, partial [Myxococcales bacterium]|nr:hypothetical protein [Myxococcales bacterium]